MEKNTTYNDLEMEIKLHQQIMVQQNQMMKRIIEKLDSKHHLLKDKN